MRKLIKNVGFPQKHFLMHTIERFETYGSSKPRNIFFLLYNTRKVEAYVAGLNSQKRFGVEHFLLSPLSFNIWSTVISSRYS